ISGLVVVVRARSDAARALGAFVGATVLLMSLAIARDVFDWSLAGNATLLHQGRVWPPAHLLGAALAGIAAARGFSWLWSRRRMLAAGTTVAVIGIGVASPVLASQDLAGILEERQAGFVYASPDLGPGSFVSRAARVLTPDDVVRVEGSDELAFLLFQFSGCKLANYDEPQLAGNDLRIRYARLAQSWNERMARGGFRAQFLALPASSDPSQRFIVTGDYEGRRWVLIKLSR
ncbi:MAG: hypothetical protein M3238_05635, partial [Actinomycetota bacterium]|nr:hypothetical protein [Actinomycetota bacterium]